jgi:hypothetical protein
MRPIRCNSLPLIHSQSMKEYTVHFICFGGAIHTRKFCKIEFHKSSAFQYHVHHVHPVPDRFVPEQSPMFQCK